MKEEWRAVVGSNKHEVSNFGRVRNLRGRLLECPGFSGTDRRRNFRLPTKNGKRKRKLVHIAVLEAFKGERKGRLGRHIDDNNQNNHVNNLEWGTRKDNADDAKRNGKLAKGARHGSARLTDEQVVEIRHRAAEGETTKTLANVFNVHEGALRSIVNGSRWKHLPGSFKKKPGPKKKRTRTRAELRTPNP